ncbi:hypothetical protein NHX12_026613 [Muraenolepis orangiensis]|uniref:Uncharacterized protein n=1 Tax=Muraenolepis orangiensis TaxID=630683 RepID=A0A9Q0EGX0_9TELE|nr:hypothetical protein NHX12_026613 [Muraenolepis orangiensis]
MAAVPLGGPPGPWHQAERAPGPWHQAERAPGPGPWHQAERAPGPWHQAERALDSIRAQPALRPRTRGLSLGNGPRGQRGQVLPSPLALQTPVPTHEPGSRPPLKVLHDKPLWCSN